ncbi:MAG: hypothetical protein HYY25_04275 [Candidatus Wallbacteria bacterium]|nr:hypothetical protein [Candidatus Wallbacteria bacterium]
MSTRFGSTDASMPLHLGLLSQGVLILLVLLLLPAAPTCERNADTSFPAPVLSKWRTWSRADGLPSDTVWAVLPDGEGVWIGTTGGLAHFDGSAFTAYRPADGLVHRAVTSLAKDPVDGSLWIGTFGGVSHLVGGKFENFTQSTSGLINDVVYAVAVQGDTVWMGTANGLSGLDRRTGAFVTYDDRNAPFHENWCYGATVSEGKLYLSVWGGGLCIRDGATGHWEVHMDPDGDNRVDVLADDGILSDVIVTASKAGERVWVASYFGAGLFDGRRWRAFSTANSGLPRNFVNTVKASGKGCWIGTDAGLSYFDGSDRWVTYRGMGGRWGEARLFRDHVPMAVAATEGSPGSDFIWSVAEATGQRRGLWVGTARGLSFGEEREAAK